MKLYVTVEEFLYAKKIENQTERTLRGYKNALNLFANWLQREWTIDELEKIRVVHLKQYVAYHLKMGHKATYVNGIIKILRAFFKYTNGEDYTDIAYEKVAWVREEKPVRIRRSGRHLWYTVTLHGVEPVHFIDIGTAHFTVNDGR